MGRNVAGLRYVSTSSVNIKYWSTIGRGRLAGILILRSTSTIVTKNINSTFVWRIIAGLVRPISTSNIVTTLIKSVIAIGRVSDLKIPMSTSSITHRNSKTLKLWNTIIVTMAGGIMSGLSRQIYKTSITTNREITCCWLLGWYCFLGVIDGVGEWTVLRPISLLRQVSEIIFFRKLDCVGGLGYNGVGDKGSIHTCYQVFLCMG